MGRRQPQSGQGALEYLAVLAVAAAVVALLLSLQSDLVGWVARNVEAVTEDVSGAPQAAAPAPAPSPQPRSPGGPSVGGILRGVADVAGFVPVVGDFVDLGVCGFEAAQGNFGDAALSCTAAVPFLGTGANAIRVGRRVDDVVDATRGLERGDDAVDAGQAACRANSFLPATPVLLADGSRRAISAVAVGDQVLATDPATGATGPRRVAAVIVGRGRKDLVSVTVGSGERAVTTTATNAHPFFVTGGRGMWVDAQDLRPGDRLRAPDGQSVTVRSVRHYQARGTVHNLSVEGVPTYYAGRQPVLVHNCHLQLPTSQTWGNPSTLARHFRDHGADFGARSADEYARMASDFFQQSQLGRLPTKIDADGVIRVYDPATNTFGAYNASGTTRTFFTPKRGIDYWNDQPGVAP